MSRRVEYCSNCGAWKVCFPLTPADPRYSAWVCPACKEPIVCTCGEPMTTAHKCLPVRAS